MSQEITVETTAPTGLGEKGRTASGQLASPTLVDDRVNLRASGILVDDMKTDMDDGEQKIHEKPIEDVLNELKTDAAQGITAAEAAERLNIYGPNELEKPPRITLCMLFIVQLNSVIMYLLIGAVIASAAIKATGKDKGEVLSYVDSIAIMIIVLINATIAAVTENNANDALEALSSLQSPESILIRGGEEITVNSADIVPGDIVKLGTGDVVPADVRCIKALDLRVNEMLLTGEPEDVAKNDKVKIPKPGEPAKLTADNMAFSSCSVKAGSAVCVVTATGMKTRVGSIAALLNDASAGGPEQSEKTEKTFEEISANCFGMLPDTKSGQSPLQANLEALAIKLGYMAIAVCSVVFVVGVLMDTKDPEDLDTPSWLFMILVAVTLTVAAIPEGLPLCVTIALSSGCETMVTKNVLVRKLAAVETLGSASIICTDKTGTLTEGKMTLVAMYTGCTDYNVTGKGFDPTVGEITEGLLGVEGGASGKENNAVLSTLGSAVLCSNTTLKLEADPDKEGVEKWIPRGNSSEAPLVVAAQKVGVTTDGLNKAYDRVYEIPFSSSRKMMVTITKTTDTNGMLKHLNDAGAGQNVAHVKGAPNIIMGSCTNYIAADGSVQRLTDDIKKSINDKVDELSEQALRVLAIAYKPLGTSLPYYEDDETDVKFGKIVHGITLCGLCASIDPERDGVKEAVLTSRTAGCRVVMITGDYLKTAIAIAKNINILNREKFREGNGQATDCGALRPGKEGEYIPNEEIDKLTRTTSVFARAKPEDKLEIVKSLQRQGWVCAMTGDGVNDAPALAKADIGVAMGLEGTEVAMGASDMVLVDDNFCSIVDAIEQGRVIYAGIQKFVSFIMSVHFAEVMQIFLCIVSSIPVMRQPLQILFLILVTDLPPSIALGFEPGEELTMKRAPRPKTQPIVLMSMWGGIVAHGMILTTCIFCTYMLALWAYAGAFLSDDITSTTRTSCTIWNDNGDWGATLDLNCAAWNACSNTVGDALYQATCSVPTDPLGTAAMAAASNTTGSVHGAVFLNYGNSACNLCIDESIRRARTCAFISLVWAEGLRAYVSRSFENPFWVDTFSNPSMNKAVGLAQVTLAFALFCPGLSDTVLGLYVYEIKWFGWVFAICGALACLIICELFKCWAKQFVEVGELANYNDDDGEQLESAATTETVVELEEIPKAEPACVDPDPRRCC